MTPAPDPLRVLAAALAPHLRELLAPAQGELVDVLATVPGRRRQTNAACRSGAIVGAAKVGRRWLATREAVNAWLRTLGPRLVPPPANDDDELEAITRAIASEPTRRTKKKQASR